MLLSLPAAAEQDTLAVCCSKINSLLVKPFATIEHPWRDKTRETAAAGCPKLSNLPKQRSDVQGKPMSCGDANLPALRLEDSELLCIARPSVTSAIHNNDSDHPRQQAGKEWCHPDQLMQFGQIGYRFQWISYNFQIRFLQPSSLGS